MSDWADPFLEIVREMREQAGVELSQGDAEANAYGQLIRQWADRLAAAIRQVNEG